MNNQYSLIKKDGSFLDFYSCLGIISRFTYISDIDIVNKYCEGLGLWCLTPLSTIFQLCRGTNIVKCLLILNKSSINNIQTSN